MSDFKQIEQEFFKLNRGTSRLHAIRDAITEADLQQDFYWRWRFRYDYVEESIFCGDRYFAMIVFPEMLNLYEQYEALHDNAYLSHSMLICFKWIVEAAPEFPQISKQEIDSYFKLFKKMLLEQGKSLSIYYMKRSLFYMHVDKNIAAADFYRFLKEPLDDISDGEALYYDQQAMYYLSVGKEEKALESAKLIFAGKLKSNALPQSTYHDFIRYYLEHGNYEKALYYAKLTIPRVNGDAYYLEVIGTLMSLYSILDVKQGLQLFYQNYPVYLQSRNPLLTMLFAVGAYHLFDKVTNEEHLDIPENTPIADMSVQEITEHFYQTASSAVQKFDARNGTNDFSDMLYLFDKRSYYGEF